MKHITLKNTLVYSLIFICSLSLFGCGGIAVPADKKDYVGTWQSGIMTLYINEEGKVYYKKSVSGSTTTVDAPIQKFVGNNFVVGALGIETTFVVSKKPWQDNGIWKMVVDGEELIKVDDNGY